jgi:ParB family chromosome partitioning protein
MWGGPEHMAQKRGLGRGLNNLIPTGDDTTETKEKTKTSSTKKTAEKEVVVKEVVKKVEQTLNINKIEPNKNQPRKSFDEDSLAELADSIKQFGIVEPLVVVKRKGYYELIAGERRWRAARLAGLKEVPVVIKDYTDQEVVEIALIENIQREDLNPIEEAHAYERLIDEFKLTQEEVAERVSKSRSTITNALRLLKLTDKVQQMLIDDMLSTGHVRALITIEDADLQYETAMYIFDNKLSVRDTESYVKKLLSGKAQKASAQAAKDEKDLSFLYKEIEEKLKNALGTKTSIKAKNGNKGKIEIEYYSQDDLERITNLLYSSHE